jgi:hypothetical protein
VSGDIVERLRRWVLILPSSHYEGCWDSHPVCAILLAADAIEARDAEIERLREHSVMLNRVSWEIDKAMGLIPDGATSHYGPDLASDLPRICELIRKGLEAEGGKT